MEEKHIKKPEEKDQPNQKTHFQVKYIPKGFFQLFNKEDTYIYEKKFSNDLPKNIIPPKSFHYPFSLENYCQSDLLTMDFGLRKNPEILTDSKINTLIHQDFINNTLELIFPNLTTISKKRTEEEQKFKKKIIEIIERNEESNQEKNEDLNMIPDFLRRQTYLRPSTAVNIDNSKLKDKSKNEKKQRTTLNDLKNSIDQSFIDIDKIKIGMKHPDPQQKGLIAKKIYEVCPMDDMPNIKFVEYLFPSEPSNVINLNEKYLKPEKFLIKMNKTNDISDVTTCSFFINNKLKTQEDHKEKDTAEYYSYETDFTINKISDSDLFNRYFFILDKVNKKLKISKLSDKYSLRRYKRILEEDIYDENNTKKIIGKKRRRNIITVPQSMQKEEFDKKKKWISDRGYNTRLTERKIENVEHTDVMEIEKEKEKEFEEERIKNAENEQEEINEEEGEYEDGEDVFNKNEKNSEEENNNEVNSDYVNNEKEGQKNEEEGNDENGDENNDNNKEEENSGEKEEQEYFDDDDEDGEDVFN